ncbi:hypothetical protein [Sphingopyxis macrogoltabida]|uniref:Uncharacterized protein n=1 Tax=Sphingopyxis macrogoltabida TaxID=33050 RepID=A0AAC9AVN2_SPHMC|nr:hypothetical protein [Sphingopyxis macrogoltabida]ALJ14108.1 hypothetical protein LH19_14640 [Sphingopyxis macrogoltabida]AMU90377.1 hypothetical protein ATM17_15230 [Sphingopyxis macrogoltabida]
MADRLKVMMKQKYDGELTPLLCTPDGTPLPGQVRVDIRTETDEPPSLTVEFTNFEFALPDPPAPGTAILPDGLPRYDA